MKLLKNRGFAAIVLIAAIVLSSLYGLSKKPDVEVPDGGVPLDTSISSGHMEQYISDEAKVLSAGMRIGFLCAPGELMQRLIVAKQFSDCHTNIFFQMVTDEWLKTCDVKAHIEKIRRIYRDKCDLMLETMDGCFDKRVAYTHPDGGLFLWCTLPEGCDSMVLSDIAMRKGVAFVPGRDFMADSDAVCPSFRLNFSTPSSENIRRGIALLDQAIREYLK